MDLLITDIIVILTFAALGWWLEGINGKHGFIDELLTPLPLGVGSAVFLLFKGLAG